MIFKLLLKINSLTNSAKRELNAKVELKQKAEEELRKCRRQLSALRIELQQAKKELKEKEEHATLAEEDIKRYLAENTKLQEKLKALSESISSPSGDPRNSALTRLLHESPAPLHFRMSNIMSTTPDPVTPPLPNKMRPRTAGLSGLTQSTQTLAAMQPKLSNPETEDSDIENSQRKKQVRKIELLSDPDPEDLKLKRLKIDAVPSSSGMFYDGFGGHSKPDVFPRGASSQPSRLAAKDGIKKTRGPVTIKVKGKTQTKTLDYFYTQ